MKGLGGSARSRGRSPPPRPVLGGSTQGLRGRATGIRRAVRLYPRGVAVLSQRSFQPKGGPNLFVT